MSVMNAKRVKVVLPRTGPDEFWTEVHRSYAGEDQRVWKYLAMFTLRVNGGWAVEHIGRAFGHPKGHVTRCLRRIETELRDRFAAPDDLWQGFANDDAEMDDGEMSLEEELIDVFGLEATIPRDDQLDH